MNERVLWVDYAKGISIILVVLGHSLLRDNNSQLYNQFLIDISDSLKFFRLPLFFFLAGLFIDKSLKISTKLFIRTKVIHFLYLYILWSLIKYSIEVVLRNIILKTQQDYLSILYIFVTPPNTLWFIYALLIFFITTRLTKKILPLTLSFSLILWTLSIQEGNHIYDITFFQNTIRYYPIFLLGYLLSKHAFILANKVKIYHLLLIPLYFLIVNYTLDSFYSSNPMLIFLLNILGILMGIIMAKNLSEMPGFKWLLYIGQNTLPIYVMHFIPLFIAKIFFEKYMILNSTISTLLIVFFGVTFPLVVYNVSSKLKIRFLFSPPSWEKKKYE